MILISRKQSVRSGFGLQIRFVSCVDRTIPGSHPGVDNQQCVCQCGAIEHCEQHRWD